LLDLVDGIAQPLGLSDLANAVKYFLKVVVRDSGNRKQLETSLSLEMLL
jgi:hypothetical protein